MLKKKLLWLSEEIDGKKDLNPKCFNFIDFVRENTNGEEWKHNERQEEKDIILLFYNKMKKK